MIEVKTAELTGPVLDWAVGIVVYGKVYVYPDGGLCPPEGTISLNEDDGTLWTNIGEFHHGDQWTPSTDWDQGGPMIASHQVNLHSPQTSDDCWAAWVTIRGKDFCQGGWQPLVAACRAIVAAKLGDVVSVPAELI